MFEKYNQIISFDVVHCDDNEMVLIIKLSILIVKIIIDVNFEMRNFLPRLTDPNFFEVLNEEEKSSFCDIENS